MPRIVKDLTGCVFGSLRVTGRDHGKPGVRWFCLCVCDAVTSVRAADLTRAKGTSSCGCLSRIPDMAGQRFGRLVVVSRGSRNTFGEQRWLCVCDCAGTKTEVLTQHLRDGSTRSCGCLMRELWTTHGLCGTAKHNMYRSAKDRARRKSIQFNISLDDIIVPDVCPYLGVKLGVSVGKGPSDNSPSLDRIDPLLGYVKGNVQVISHQANRVKNNLSFAQFEQFYLNWKRQNEPVALATGDDCYGSDSPLGREALGPKHDVGFAGMAAVHGSLPIDVRDMSSAVSTYQRGDSSPGDEGPW